MFTEFYDNDNIIMIITIKFLPVAVLELFSESWTVSGGDTHIPEEARKGRKAVPGAGGWTNGPLLRCHLDLQEINSVYGLNKHSGSLLFCYKRHKSSSKDLGLKTFYTLPSIMPLYDIAVQKLGFPTIELFVKVGL